MGREMVRLEEEGGKRDGKQMRGRGEKGVKRDSHMKGKGRGD